MSDIEEFDIVSDGEGIVLFGNGKALDLFLKREDLDFRTLDMTRIVSTVGKASTIANGMAQAALNAGRWVKLSEKSAKAMRTSKMMKGSSDGLVRAIFTGDKGKIKGIVEIVKPGAAYANPAALANITGMMTQFALQQSIDDINKYLEVIDVKIDDIIRVQKDSVIADMLGVGFVIDEAMTIRRDTGKVSEVTWSKVQATSYQLARTQAYALLQLEDINKKLEKEKSIASLVKATQEAERTIAEWLAVLARSSQLNDAVGVLELDRVLDSHPEDLESHRDALKAARQQRLDQLTNATASLIGRVEAIGAYANGKLLLNPFESPAVIKASNTIGSRVVEFQEVLEIGESREDLTARLWAEAALELRDDLVETTKRIGSSTVDGTKKTVEASKKAFDESKKALNSAKEAVMNAKEVQEASKQALDASKQAIEESKKALSKGSQWIAERASKFKKSD